jgi:predicted  nucleic acid-binding Zn-ribbon protein
MATEKTPPHKRISRAENSAAQWKIKAIERREAAEALQAQLATASENAKIKNAELDEANKRCANLEKHANGLTEQLRSANQAIATLQAEMNTLKKRLSR